MMGFRGGARRPGIPPQSPLPSGTPAPGAGALPQSPIPGGAGGLPGAPQMGSMPKPPIPGAPAAAPSIQPPQGVNVGGSPVTGMALPRRTPTPGALGQMGSNGGPGATPPVDTRPDWQKDMDGMLADADKQSAAERDQINQNTNNQLGAAARHTAFLNARLGRSAAGGGFAQSYAQGQLGVLDNQRKALAEQGLRAGDQRQNLMLSLNDKLFQADQQKEQFIHENDLNGDGNDPVGGWGAGTTKLWEGQKAGIMQKLSPEDQAKFEELYNNAQTQSGSANDIMKKFLDDHGITYTTRGQQKVTSSKKNAAGAKVALRNFEDQTGMTSARRRDEMLRYLRTGRGN